MPQDAFCLSLRTDFRGSRFTSQSGYRYERGFGCGDSCCFGRNRYYIYSRKRKSYTLYNKDTLRKLLTAKLIPEKPEAKKMKGKALKKHKKNAPDAKKEQGADK